LPVEIAPKTNRLASGEENCMSVAEIHRLTPIAPCKQITGLCEILRELKAIDTTPLNGE
jgi:hypothetical protein